MKKLRIAHVVHGFSVGGLERGVARLVNRLDPAAYDHLILCLGSIGGAAEWLRPDRTKLVTLPKRHGNDLSLVRRLGRRLATERVDLAHSHNWGTLVETAWACRRAGVGTWVHGLHGAPTEGLHVGRLRAGARARVTRFALAKAHAVTAVSESVQRAFVEWCGVSADKIEVIANGVDRVDPATIRRAREVTRRRLGMSPMTTVIGSVGRLEPVKGFDLALGALAQLAEGGWDVHLLLVGDGSAEADLRRQAERLGVTGRLSLVGGQIEALPWLAAMDVFLNSSRSEGLSQSLLEAMAAGLPLAVTDVGESARLVSGETPCGLVAPPEDARALAAALLELKDSGRRRRFSRRARQLHRRDYRTESMVRRYDELYRRVSTSRIAG